MNASIGIQTIMPQTGTSQDRQQQAYKDVEFSEPAVTDENEEQQMQLQSPPPEGMGQNIDKSV